MGKLNFNRENGYFPFFDKKKFHLKMKQMFGCDLRSIALFRIIMAACVIGDVIERMADLRVMYTDEGIMPRALIVSRYSSNYFFPIHLINTSWGFQFILFNAHILVAFLMLIGYRTKTFSFLTWFMTISLQAYNGIVGHGGDVFFRMMLFLAMFLPTAELYSVDSATFANDKNNSKLHIDLESNENSNSSNPEGSVANSSVSEEVTIQFENYSPSNNVHVPKPLRPEYTDNRYRYLSFASFCVLLQMGCMYVSSYFHKTGEEWKNGEATFYAITLDYFSTDFAKFIVQFREPIRLLTIAVAKWELLGVFFFSVPFFTDYFRLFAAIGFFCLHAGFVMCLRLGLFFFVTAGAQSINIPPVVWDTLFNWADKKILRGLRPTKIHYNTSSPLSQFIALTLKTFFILPNTAEFSPLERINSQDRISQDSVNINSEDDQEDTNNDDESVDDNDKEDGIMLNNRKKTSTPSTPKNRVSNRFSDSKSLLLGDDWLVSIEGNGIRKSNIHALLHVCSISPLLFPFAKLCKMVPANVSSVFDKVFLFIHHYSQTNQVQSNKPSLYQDRKHPIKPYSRWYRIVNNVWMAFICWFLLAYNCNTFHYVDLGFKPEYNQLAYLLRLDQGWNMFSPSPPKTHWWHVIHGNLDDGTPVELFKNEGVFNFEIHKDVNFDKPEPFYKSYGNHRWFKYWENGFNQQGADPMRLEMGRYICREFNKRHFGSEMLHRFTIYFVYEHQNLDGTLSSPPQHSALWDHLCY